MAVATAAGGRPRPPPLGGRRGTGGRGRLPLRLPTRFSAPRHTLEEEEERQRNTRGRRTSDGRTEPCVAGQTWTSGALQIVTCSITEAARGRSCKTIRRYVRLYLHLPSPLSPHLSSASWNFEEGGRDQDLFSPLRQESSFYGPGLVALPSSLLPPIGAKREFASPSPASTNELCVHRVLRRWSGSRRSGGGGGAETKLCLSYP